MSLHSAAHRGGFFIGQTKIEPKPEPTGTQTIRIADIPMKQRLHAFSLINRYGELTSEEAEDMFALILDPGERGGRVAA